MVSLSSEPLRLTVTGEAPEGTQFLAPLIRASGPADIGVVSPSLRPQVGATLIEDGAITTGKIETGAITSDSGIFGEVDAGILNAGEIAAARIGANTITSDKLLVGEFIELAPSLASYSGEVGALRPSPGDRTYLAAMTGRASSSLKGVIRELSGRGVTLSLVTCGGWTRSAETLLVAERGRGALARVYDADGV